MQAARIGVADNPLPPPTVHHVDRPNSLIHATTKTSKPQALPLADDTLPILLARLRDVAPTVRRAVAARLFGVPPSVLSIGQRARLIGAGLRDRNAAVGLMDRGFFDWCGLGHLSLCPPLASHLINTEPHTSTRAPTEPPPTPPTANRPPRSSRPPRRAWRGGWPRSAAGMPSHCWSYLTLRPTSVGCWVVGGLLLGFRLEGVGRRGCAWAMGACQS